MRKSTTHPPPVFGACEVQMMVVASISYSLLVPASTSSRRLLPPGAHLTLLPRGPAAEQTVGSPRSHHRRHSSATTPGLISAAVGRTEPPLGWEHASSSRKQVAAAGRREQVRPPGLPASQCPPLLLPRTPPNRPLGSMMGGESASPIVCVTMRPPFITPRPLPTLRRVSGLESFGVRCPAGSRLTTSCPGRWATGACTAWGRGRPKTPARQYKPHLPARPAANITIMILDSKSTSRQLN